MFVVATMCGSCGRTADIDILKTSVCDNCGSDDLDVIDTEATLETDAAKGRYVVRHDRYGDSYHHQSIELARRELKNTVPPGEWYVYDRHEKRRVGDDEGDQHTGSLEMEAANDAPIPDDVGARDVDQGTIASQVGKMNILSISGGRVRGLYKGRNPVGIQLPVSQGYAVNIYLANDDTYTVQRVFRGRVMGEQKGIYFDQVGEAAYQAGMYQSNEFGGHRKGGGLESEASPLLLSQGPAAARRARERGSRQSHSTTCPRCGAHMDEVRTYDNNSRLEARCSDCGWRGTKSKTSKRENPYGTCPKCGSGRYRKDFKSCVQCGYKGKESSIDPRHDMDQLHDVSGTSEMGHCSSCLQTFKLGSTDPTDPVPQCPHCGSMATSVAGATNTHTAADSTSGEMWAEVKPQCLNCNRHLIPGSTYRVISPVYDAGACSQSCANSVANMLKEKHADTDPGATVEIIAPDTQHMPVAAAREAKLDQITAGVLETNPGMNREAARALAEKTLARFPRLAAVKEEGPEPNLDMPHALQHYIDQYRQQHTSAEKSPKFPLLCGECGNRFSRTIGRNTYEVKCPRCGSYDTEPDYQHPNGHLWP